MEIYGWEVALGIIGLALAISIVRGARNKLRGGSFLPEDTFIDRRTNRWWRDSDGGAIEEAMVPRPGILKGAGKVVLGVVAASVALAVYVKFWDLLISVLH
jgi:hypothetical protein